MRGRSASASTPDGTRIRRWGTGGRPWASGGSRRSASPTGSVTSSTPSTPAGCGAGSGWSPRWSASPVPSRSGFPRRPSSGGSANAWWSTIATSSIFGIPPPVRTSTASSTGSSRNSGSAISSSTTTSIQAPGPRVRVWEQVRAPGCWRTPAPSATGSPAYAPATPRSASRTAAPVGCAPITTSWPSRNCNPPATSRTSACIRRWRPRRRPRSCRSSAGTGRTRRPR